VARATERGEGTDLLSKQCEWVVRIGRLEDAENTLKYIYYPRQCKDSDEACKIVEQSLIQKQYPYCTGFHSDVCRVWQEPEPSHVTGMALAHCILGKFLGVVFHCFPRL